MFQSANMHEQIHLRIIKLGCKRYTFIYFRKYIFKRKKRGKNKVTKKDASTQGNLWLNKENKSIVNQRFLSLGRKERKGEDKMYIYRQNRTLKEKNS